MINRRTLMATGALAAAALAAMPASTASAENHASQALTAQSRTVEIEGGTIAYRRFGQGRPLLFIQRFRGGMDDWDPALLDALAHGREVILFDSLGVSESTGETPSTLEGAADIAAHLIAALGLDKPDIIGWSMGGMTAQILALRYPDAIGKVILAGTTPAGGTPEFTPPSQDWFAVAGQPQYTVDDLTFLFFTDTPAGQAAGAASAERISARRPAQEMKTTPAVMAAQVAATTSFLRNEGGWYERLPEINTAVLVANGDRDASFPVINSVILAREIPGAQLVIYPDAGHGFHFQYAERFAEDALQFLND